MKKELIATAALFAVGVQAQVSGPNRPGPGTSPGTFQQLTPPTTMTPGTLPNTTLTPAVPQTRLGTPDARMGASDPFRRPGSINDSRSWDQNVGAPATLDSGSGRFGQPVQGANPQTLDESNPRTLDSTTPRILGEPPQTTTSGAVGLTETPRVRSNLNTTGVNTPARVIEQPFDRALSAKVRAQLSQTPLGSRPTRLSAETIRDLRITSQNGRLLLEGEVVSEQERILIEDRVRQVQGVGNIENRLRVRGLSQGAPPASQTGRTVRDAAAEQELQDFHRELTPNR